VALSAPWALLQDDANEKFRCIMLAPCSFCVAICKEQQSGLELVIKEDQKIMKKLIVICAAGALLLAACGAEAATTLLSLDYDPGWPWPGNQR